MRINKTIFIDAGEPVNIWTGSPSADQAPVMARSLSCQMQHGGSGIGFVMGGISRNRVPAQSNSADVTAELAPATATAPGGSYYDSSEEMGIDVNSFWVDGSSIGDFMIVSYDLKN